MMRAAFLALVFVVTACAPEDARGPESSQESPPPPISAEPRLFEADSAWASLVHQVEAGPRVPGTASHRRCADWLASTLERFGGVVERTSFSYRDPDGYEWPLENILGEFGPEGAGRLLLVAHWDSRPWADEDPDTTRRDEPIPGAGDGAAGVAVLLEVARTLGETSLPRGVDILFADGEDLGRPGNHEGYCRGTRRFVERGVDRYRRAVVVDLVGDSDLHLPMEIYSLQRAPEVVDWVWERGIRLSPGVFSRTLGKAVYDDHVPLLDAGLPAVDIIDFDYPAWHTHADDLGAVSRYSLAAVGRVILSLAVDP